MPKSYNNISNVLTALIKPISIGVVVGLAIKFFYQKVQKAFGGTGQSLIVTKTNLSNVVNNVSQDANITKTQAQVIADQLLQAFNDMGLTAGTDESLIFSSLDENYNISARELIWATFSVKPYGLTGSPNWLQSFTASELDLGGWLTKELSSDDLQYSQNYFSNTIFNF